MSDGPLVLGIETSCDETGVGIVRGTTLLADEVASSVEEHARFGGVVPEVASRAHLEAMLPTMSRALKAAGVRLSDVDAIAVTAGPGLAGALLVGVAAAKGYALAAEKPIYGVNHLAAHVAVDTLEHGALPPSRPSRCWSRVGTRRCCWSRTWPGASHRSGPRSTTPRARRTTRWPACSACRSRAARRSTMAAQQGDPGAIAFPRGLTAPKDQAEHRFDFSFSGLKTAVARWVEARQRAGEPVPVADVAASFQEAVCDVLTAKADRCLPRARRRHAGDRRRGGRELAPAGAGRRSGASRQGIALRVPRPRCAPTTARWSPHSGRTWSRPGHPPSRARSPGRLGARDHYSGRSNRDVQGRARDRAHVGGTGGARTFTDLCSIGSATSRCRRSRYSPLHVSSEVFSSPDFRLVVISKWRSNPEAFQEPPPHLITRAPHSWDFSPVDR